MTNVIGYFMSIRDAINSSPKSFRIATWYGNTFLCTFLWCKQRALSFASSRSGNMFVCRAARRFDIESEIPVSDSGSKKVTHVCYIVSLSVELKPASLSAN